VSATNSRRKQRGMTSVTSVGSLKPSGVRDVRVFLGIAQMDAAEDAVCADSARELAKNTAAGVTNNP
jgi:hypothetical protein